MSIISKSKGSAETNSIFSNGADPDSSEVRDTSGGIEEAISELGDVEIGRSEEEKDENRFVEASVGSQAEEKTGYALKDSVPEKIELESGIPLINIHLDTEYLENRENGWNPAELNNRLSKKLAAKAAKKSLRQGAALDESVDRSKADFAVMYLEAEYLSENPEAVQEISCIETESKGSRRNFFEYLEEDMEKAKQWLEDARTALDHQDYFAGYEELFSGEGTRLLRYVDEEEFLDWVEEEHNPYMDEDSLLAFE